MIAILDDDYDLKNQDGMTVIHLSKHSIADLYNNLSEVASWASFGVKAYVIKNLHGYPRVFVSPGGRLEIVKNRKQEMKHWFYGSEDLGKL